MVIDAGRLGAMIDLYERTGSYAAVAREFGVTRVRVRAILNQAGVPKRAKVPLARPPEPEQPARPPRPTAEQIGGSPRPRAVSITDVDYDDLEEAGSGNASEGVRRVLAFWRTARRKG